MAPSYNSQFTPAWWCCNPHLQTLWPYLFRRQPRPVYQRERFELVDGDFIDLDWYQRQQYGPIVVILHGLGGCSHSHYVRGVVGFLAAAGYRCVVAQHRGCSGEPNRRARSYYAGATEDLDSVLSALRQREPETPLFAIGYSLGGSMLLHWLSQNPGQHMLTATAAVSVPLLLAEGAWRMQRGLSRLYQWRLINLLKQHTRRKYSLVNAVVDITGLDEICNFHDFDHRITAPLHGFRDVNHYYQACSARQCLATIQTRCLILHAADDPLLTNKVIPGEREISPAVRFELSRRGGHCGFVTGTLPGRARYWADQRILRFFNETPMV